MTNETYIGDGLYASFDGFQFKLRAPRENGDHEVYLDQNVLDGFFEYLQKSLQVKILVEDVSHDGAGHDTQYHAS